MTSIRTVSLCACVALFVPAARARADMKVGWLGQSILHNPGGAEGLQGKLTDRVTGRNHFFYFLEWAKTGTETVEHVHVTASGAGLYTYVDQDGRIFNADVVRMVGSGLDYFVITEGTAYIFGLNKSGPPPEFRGTTEERARALVALARSKNVIPIIYVPYAHSVTQPGDWPMKDPVKVMQRFTELAGKLNVAFVPVAHAIAAAASRFGYDRIYSDDIHINSAGQFLAACVDWAILSRTPPEALVFKGDRGGVDVTMARELTEICKQTVKAFPQPPALLRGPERAAPSDAGSAATDAGSAPDALAGAMDARLTSGADPSSAGVVDARPPTGSDSALRPKDARPPTPDPSVEEPTDDQRRGRVTGGCSVSGGSSVAWALVLLALLPRLRSSGRRLQARKPPRSRSR